MTCRLLLHPLLPSLVVLSCLAVSPARADSAETDRRAGEQPLLNIAADMDLDRLQTRDAQLSLDTADGQPILRMETGRQQQWPGMTVPAPGGRWDLSAYETIELEVRNAGDRPVRVGLRADDAATRGNEGFIQVAEEIAAGQQKTLRLTLERRVPPQLRDKLFGMRGYPGRLSPDKGIDVAAVTQVLIFASQPQQTHVLELRGLKGSGVYDEQRWLTADPDELFPMIDRFGQYMHKDWPGKTASEADLQARIAREDADLAAQPGPADWNPYGGWQAGPQLEASGYFRVARHAGAWWLVDPAGRLFWSHGNDCVRAASATTPITDREFYFAELPAQDSPLGPFYGRASWAPHGYYQDKPEYATYNFTASNLYRKYGPAWREVFADRAHQRLRSWGQNTIGNWSDADIYRRERTPYVVTAGSGRRPIEGSSGYWGKFPDPFAAEFRTTTRRNLAAQREAAGSPWCLGVFVDNELAWGDELSLAIATLASPPQQPAKQVFLADLQQKYPTIEQLNAAWGTEHSAWQELLDSTRPPRPQAARADLEAFATRIAEQYFHVCREAVKEVAPQTLYLGCRFAWVNDRAIRAAAKYCDVIGFNKYQDSVAGFRLPAGVDLPVIIGEFHFGALDRGMFHTGLRKTASQQERAEAYRRYVQGAAENPWIVGTHWFQFGDQATTGRGDGENYQIGFLDVCDNPYPEIVAASRAVAAELYPLRLERAGSR